MRFCETVFETASSSAGRHRRPCNRSELGASSILDVFTRFHYFRSLLCDPFANVRRAVPKYRSFALFLSKEFHDLSICQNDVLQIEGHRTRFLLHYVSKCIHIPFCNPAADAQLHNVVDNNAVDSPGQFKTADNAFALLLIVPFWERLLQRRAMT
jgi:hypothetical protein